MSRITLTLGAVAAIVLPVLAQSNIAPYKNYAYVNCYTDDSTSQSTRTFPLEPYANINAMTIEECIDFCSDSSNGVGPLSYVGLQYMHECWCGNGLNPHAAIAPATDCHYACSGAPNELCGGDNRLSVYAVVNPAAIKSSSLAAYSTSKSLSLATWSASSAAASLSRSIYQSQYTSSRLSSLSAWSASETLSSLNSFTTHSSHSSVQAAATTYSSNSLSLYSSLQSSISSSLSAARSAYTSSLAAHQTAWSLSISAHQSLLTSLSLSRSAADFSSTARSSYTASSKSFAAASLSSLRSSRSSVLSAWSASKTLSSIAASSSLAAHNAGQKRSDDFDLTSDVVLVTPTPTTLVTIVSVRQLKDE